jgi:broad specificity phosphatase PhoE
MYASPLLRAYQTAEAVRAGQPEGSRPPLHANPKLRERHFGIAEGYPVTFGRPGGRSYDQCIQEGIYPVPITRQEKFPGGESEEDLDARADEAVAECILPHLNDTTKEKEHIAIASHGLAISALVAALLRLDPEADRSVSYAGLLNTAWTRVVISNRVRDASVLGACYARICVNRLF